MVKSRFAVAFVLLLLLMQPCMAAWKQNVTVIVKDQNGIPVEGADIRMGYQRLSTTSEDGKAYGRTNEQGQYSTILDNRVQNSTFESFIVSAGTFYWKSAEKRVNTSKQNLIVNFTVPYSLEENIVRVSYANGQPVEDASVYVEVSGLKKTTGPSGEVSFFIPASQTFSGGVSIGNSTVRFNSSSSKIEGKHRIISVKLTSLPGQALGGVAFNLAVLDMNNTAIANQVVVLVSDKGNVSKTSDSSGVASFFITKSGQVGFSIEKYGHTYRFFYNVSVSNTSGVEKQDETAVLKSLLSISQFSSKEESKNCYSFYAIVSDPRIEYPLTVTISKTTLVSGNESIFAQLPVAINEDGQYTSRLCINSNSRVYVYASNKFETAKKSIDLQFKPAVISPPPSTQTEPVVSDEQIQINEMILSLIALGLLVGAVYGYITARPLIHQMIRFIIEYLRIVLGKFLKK